MTNELQIQDLNPDLQLQAPHFSHLLRAFSYRKPIFIVVVFYGEMISIDSQILFSGWSAAFLLVLEKSVITALKLLTHRINI